MTLKEIENLPAGWALNDKDPDGDYLSYWHSGSDLTVGVSSHGRYAEPNNYVVSIETVMDEGRWDITLDSPGIRVEEAMRVAEKFIRAFGEIDNE